MGLDVVMNVSVGDTGRCGGGGGGGGKWRAPPDNTVQVVKPKHLRDIDDEVIHFLLIRRQLNNFSNQTGTQ